MTKRVSNSRRILKELCKCTGTRGRCTRPNGGTHRVCSGDVAPRAAVYPFELRGAVLTCPRNQVRDSESFVSFISGMLLKPDESRTVRHILKKAHNLQGRRSMLMSSTESEGGARATVHRWLRAAVSCRPSKFSCPGPAELPGSGAMAKRRR